MYGIGARLDEKPELFFLLRGVDQNELFSADIADALVDSAAPAAIADDDLNGIFGIELDSLDGDIEVPAAPKKRKPGRPKKAASVKTPAKRKSGRPKKAAEKPAVAATPAKRKPGRPKKSEAATPKKTASATGKKSTAKITRKVSKKNTAGKIQ